MAPANRRMADKPRGAIKEQNPQPENRKVQVKQMKGVK